MSKRILCGLLIVSLLFVCGCWDIREGESQAFVLGIGMDAASPDSYTYIFEVASPQAIFGQQSGDEKTVNVTVTARTTEQAMVLAQRQIGREMNLEHLQIVVITQKLAEQGFGGLLDYLFGSNAMRRTLKIAVLDNTCSLETLMELQPVQAPSLADTMRTLLAENLGSSGKRYDAGSILEMILNSVEQDRLDYVVSRIGWDENSGMLKLLGGTVLRNGFAVQAIDADALNALYWLRSEDSRPHLTVPAGEDQWEFLVQQQNAVLKTEIVSGMPRVTVSIRAVCQMVENKNVAGTGNGYSCTPEEAAAAVEEKLLTDCRKLIDDSKLWDVDILNLSGRLRTREYRWWQQNGENFYDLYKEIPIDVTVDIDVRRVGNAT